MQLKSYPHADLAVELIKNYPGNVIIFTPRKEGIHIFGCRMKIPFYIQAANEDRV